MTSCNLLVYNSYIVNKARGNTMSKKALQNIIDQQNFWAKISNKPEVNIDTLTAEQAEDIYETIDCGLSPENLHCDGEISRSAAMKKYNTYMQAVKELKRMGHPVPNTCYEIN